MAKVIVIDDVELNRVLLKEAFTSTYETLEAENGKIGIKKILENQDSLVAIFLDIIMPEMDGFAVLEELEKRDILRTIPVFLITTEGTKAVVDKAYDYGVVDVIQKPFNMRVINRRVTNTIELYRNRNNLEDMVSQQLEVIMSQTQKLHRASWEIIEGIAGIIEFRSGETGNHIQRVKVNTEVIGDDFSLHYPDYALTEWDVKTIAQASVLHDIGKIAISDSVLEKPGKLTSEEFDKMKTHTLEGFNMLKRFKGIDDEKLRSFCEDITLYHHEKWDGKGYPKGLKEDEIPISAQIVSLADVYDALLSKRCYKPAFTKDEAVKMINNGECGIFNPKLLESFNRVADKIYDKYYGKLFDENKFTL